MQNPGAEQNGDSPSFLQPGAQKLPELEAAATSLSLTALY